MNIKNAGRFIFIFVVISSLTFFALPGQSQPDMEYDQVKYNFGLIRGMVGWPKGEVKKLEPEEAHIAKDKEAVYLKYTPKYKELRKCSSLRDNCFVLEFEYNINQIIPYPPDLVGKVSYYESEEEDEDPETQPFNDDGENDKGWEEPNPKNIPEDFEEPELWETEEETEYSEDMNGYSKEGIDAELLVFEEVVGLKRYRLVIFNNLEFPKWNQIALSFGEQLLELHLNN